jgi:hypothetical protein
MSQPRFFVVLVVSTMLASGCVISPSAPLIHSKYHVSPTGQQDDFDEPADRSATSAVFAAGAHAGDIFAGTDRRDPKTSIATGNLEVYSTVRDLRATLQSDKDMRDLGIPKSPDSERRPEEQRNVTVGGFIYCISKESDNDFHLIVGDKDCDSGDCFVNVEVSGWPQATDDPNRPTLMAVRTKLLNYFGDTEPGTSHGYDKYNPPLPVTLTGSLFFDVDHPAGAVGPRGFKPNSAWEIHPLTDIAFEP